MHTRGHAGRAARYGFLGLLTALAGAAWADPVGLQARDLDGNAANGPEAWYSPSQGITWLPPLPSRGDTFADTQARLDRLNTAMPGLDGWRLPRVLPVHGGSDYTGPERYDGTTDFGWNIAVGHELAVLFHVVLGNMVYRPDGTALDKPDVRNGLGPFDLGQLDERVNYLLIWQQTPPGLELDKGLQFQFDWWFGRQTARVGTSADANLFWAVHDGDVGRALQVPEPGGLALLGLGMLVLMQPGMARRRAFAAG